MERIPAASTSAIKRARRAFLRRSASRPRGATETTLGLRRTAATDSETARLRAVERTGIGAGSATVACLGRDWMSQDFLADIWNEGFRNEHGAIGLLIAFDKHREQAW